MNTKAPNKAGFRAEYEVSLPEKTWLAVCESLGIDPGRYHTLRCYPAPVAEGTTDEEIDDLEDLLLEIEAEVEALRPKGASTRTAPEALREPLKPRSEPDPGLQPLDDLDLDDLEL